MKRFRGTGPATGVNQAPRGSLTPTTVPLLLKARVLNNTLTDDYRRWYPDFTHTTDQQHLAAQPPTVCPALPDAWHDQWLWPCLNPVKAGHYTVRGAAGSTTNPASGPPCPHRPVHRRTLTTGSTWARPR